MDREKTNQVIIDTEDQESRSKEKREINKEEEKENDEESPKSSAEKDDNLQFCQDEEETNRKKEKCAESAQTEQDFEEVESLKKTVETVHEKKEDENDGVNEDPCLKENKIGTKANMDIYLDPLQKLIKAAKKKKYEESRSLLKEATCSLEMSASDEGNVLIREGEDDTEKKQKLINNSSTSKDETRENQQEMLESQEVGSQVEKEAPTKNSEKEAESESTEKVLETSGTEVAAFIGGIEEKTLGKHKSKSKKKKIVEEIREADVHSKGNEFLIFQDEGSRTQETKMHKERLGATVEQEKCSRKEGEINEKKIGSQHSNLSCEDAERDKQKRRETCITKTSESNKNGSNVDGTERKIKKNDEGTSIRITNESADSSTSSCRRNKILECKEPEKPTEQSPSHVKDCGEDKERKCRSNRKKRRSKNTEGDGRRGGSNRGEVEQDWQSSSRPNSPSKSTESKKSSLEIPKKVKENSEKLVEKRTKKINKNCDFKVESCSLSTKTSKKGKKVKICSYLLNKRRLKKVQQRGNWVVHTGFTWHVETQRRYEKKKARKLAFQSINSVEQQFGLQTTIPSEIPASLTGGNWVESSLESQLDERRDRTVQKKPQLKEEIAVDVAGASGESSVEAQGLKERIELEEEKAMFEHSVDAKESPVEIQILRKENRATAGLKNVEAEVETSKQSLEKENKGAVVKKKNKKLKKERAISQEVGVSNKSSEKSKEENEGPVEKKITMAEVKEAVKENFAEIQEENLDEHSLLIRSLQEKDEERKRANSEKAVTEELEEASNESFVEVKIVKERNQETRNVEEAPRESAAEVRTQKDEGTTKKKKRENSNKERTISENIEVTSDESSIETRELQEKNQGTVENENKKAVMEEAEEASKESSLEVRIQRKENRATAKVEDVKAEIEASKLSLEKEDKGAVVKKKSKKSKKEGAISEKIDVSDDSSVKAKENEGLVETKTKKAAMEGVKETLDENFLLIRSLQEKYEERKRASSEKAVAEEGEADETLVEAQTVEEKNQEKRNNRAIVEVVKEVPKESSLEARTRKEHEGTMKKKKRANLKKERTLSENIEVTSDESSIETRKLQEKNRGTVENENETAVMQEGGEASKESSWEVQILRKENRAIAEVKNEAEIETSKQSLEKENKAAVVQKKSKKLKKERAISEKVDVSDESSVNAKGQNEEPVEKKIKKAEMEGVEEAVKENSVEILEETLDENSLLIRSLQENYGERKRANSEKAVAEEGEADETLVEAQTVEEKNQEKRDNRAIVEVVKEVPKESSLEARTREEHEGTMKKKKRANLKKERTMSENIEVTSDESSIETRELQEKNQGTVENQNKTLMEEGEEASKESSWEIQILRKENRATAEVKNESEIQTSKLSLEKENKGAVVEKKSKKLKKERAISEKVDLSDESSVKAKGENEGPADKKNEKFAMEEAKEATEENAVEIIEETLDENSLLLQEKNEERVNSERAVTEEVEKTADETLVEVEDGKEAPKGSSEKIRTREEEHDGTMKNKKKANLKKERTISQNFEVTSEGSSIETRKLHEKNKRTGGNENGTTVMEEVEEASKESSAEGQSLKIEREGSPRKNKRTNLGKETQQMEEASKQSSLEVQSLKDENKQIILKNKKAKVQKEEIVNLQVKETSHESNTEAQSWHEKHYGSVINRPVTEEAEEPSTESFSADRSLEEKNQEIPAKEDTPEEVEDFVNNSEVRNLKVDSQTLKRKKELNSQDEKIQRKKKKQKLKKQKAVVEEGISAPSNIREAEGCPPTEIRIIDKNEASDSEESSSRKEEKKSPDKGKKEDEYSKYAEEDFRRENKGRESPGAACPSQPFNDLSEEICFLESIPYSTVKHESISVSKRKPIFVPETQEEEEQPEGEEEVCNTSVEEDHVKSDILLIQVDDDDEIVRSKSRSRSLSPEYPSPWASSRPVLSEEQESDIFLTQQDSDSSSSVESSAAVNSFMSFRLPSNAVKAMDRVMLGRSGNLSNLVTDPPVDSTQDDTQGHLADRATLSLDIITESPSPDVITQYSSEKSSQSCQLAFSTDRSSHENECKDSACHLAGADSHSFESVPRGTPEKKWVDATQYPVGIRSPPIPLASGKIIRIIPTIRPSYQRMPNFSNYSTPTTEGHHIDKLLDSHAKCRNDQGLGDNKAQPVLKSTFSSSEDSHVADVTIASNQGMDQGLNPVEPASSQGIAEETHVVAEKLSPNFDSEILELLVGLGDNSVVVSSPKEAIESDNGVELENEKLEDQSTKAEEDDATIKSPVFEKRNPQLSYIQTKTPNLSKLLTQISLKPKTKKLRSSRPRRSEAQKSSVSTPKQVEEQITQKDVVTSKDSAIDFRKDLLEEKDFPKSSSPPLIVNTAPVFPCPVTKPETDQGQSKGNCESKVEKLNEEITEDSEKESFQPKIGTQKADKNRKGNKSTPNQDSEKEFADNTDTDPLPPPLEKHPVQLKLDEKQIEDRPVQDEVLSGEIIDSQTESLEPTITKKKVDRKRNQNRIRSPVSEEGTPPHLAVERVEDDGVSPLSKVPLTPPSPKGGSPLKIEKILETPARDNSPSSAIEKSFDLPSQTKVEESEDSDVPLNCRVSKYKKLGKMAAQRRAAREAAIPLPVSKSKRKRNNSGTLSHPKKKGKVEKALRSVTPQTSESPTPTPSPKKRVTRAASKNQGKSCVFTSTPLQIQRPRVIQSGVKLAPSRLPESIDNALKRISGIVPPRNLLTNSSSHKNKLKQQKQLESEVPSDELSSESGTNSEQLNRKRSRKLYCGINNYLHTPSPSKHGYASEPCPRETLPPESPTELSAIRKCSSRISKVGGIIENDQPLDLRKCSGQGISESDHPLDLSIRRSKVKKVKSNESACEASLSNSNSSVNSGRFQKAAVVAEIQPSELGSFLSAVKGSGKLKPVGVDWLRSADSSKSFKLLLLPSPKGK